MGEELQVMLQAIAEAGYVVSMYAPATGVVAITARNSAGETWRVTADTPLKAVAVLAHVLGFGNEAPQTKAV